MDTTLIVAANAGRARFFVDQGGAAHWQEIHDMVNEAARLRAADLETDRMGPTSAGKSVHNTGGPTPNKTYEPAQTPEEHETEQFARDVAGFLAQCQRDGRFQQLVLSAAPQFLGVLRKLLAPQLKPLLRQEINKDYTALGPDQLREQISQPQG